MKLALSEINNKKNIDSFQNVPCILTAFLNFFFKYYE